MDNNNWRPAQGGAESAIDTGDWRTQLQNESRQRIVNKIMNTLKRHLPFSGQEGLLELKRMAIRFEEKIYTTATSQSDYLRKISLKMLTMESKSQNSMTNSLPSYPADAASSDSTAQTGSGNSGDWQEEVYQKILTMKEAYMSELQEMYLKIAGKLQQHDNLPQQPKNEQVEKLKIVKTMLERIMTFLQIPKNNILPTFNEKLEGYEKQILNFLNSNRSRKPGALMQQFQQLTQPHMHQPQLSQISQAQSHDNPMSSQVQAMNLQGSVNTWLQNNVTSLQHNSLSSLSGVPNASQSLMNPLQSISNLSSSQGNPLNTMPQAAVGFIQQSSSAPQQCNSNMLPHQQLKQEEQQILPNQMTQKFQQHHMQHQLILKQQLQRQILQQKQQQNSQMQANQMSQLHQINDMDMKMRQQLGVKGGSLPQNQRSMYHHQQLKSGSPQCPISSPQLLQAQSPQMPLYPSPQIDQKSLLPSLTKTGTPLQSANSPFIVPSPFAPSPMPGDPEKAVFGVSALPTVGSGGHQQVAVAVTPAQSLATGIPGILASPLLAECTPDGTLGNMSKVVSGKSGAAEQPLDRLLKAVSSILLIALCFASIYCSFVTLSQPYHLCESMQHKLWSSVLAFCRSALKGLVDRIMHL